MKKIRICTLEFYYTSFYEKFNHKKIPKVHENQEGFIVDSITNTLTKASLLQKKEVSPQHPKLFVYNICFFHLLIFPLFTMMNSTLNIFAIQSGKDSMFPFQKLFCNKGILFIIRRMFNNFFYNKLFFLRGLYQHRIKCFLYFFKKLRIHETGFKC